MTINDVIALSKAGFTADQISKMAMVQPQPQPQPQPQSDQFSAIMNQLSGLTGAIQNANILASNIKVPEAETTDMILASIINPPDLGGNK